MHAIIKFAAGPLWNVALRTVLHESQRLPFENSAFQNDQGINAIEVAHGVSQAATPILFALPGMTTSNRAKCRVLKCQGGTVASRLNAMFCSVCQAGTASRGDADDSVSANDRSTYGKPCGSSWRPKTPPARQPRRS